MKILFLVFLLSQLSHATANGLLPQKFVSLGGPTQVVIKGKAFTLQKEKKVGSKGGTDDLHLRIIAGKLGPSQFQDLMRLFPDGKNVAYDPNKIYELKDFLRPSIRLTEGSVFKSYTRKSPELERWVQKYGAPDIDVTPEVNFVTNCWQTALEVLRNDPSGMWIYYPNQAEASKFFRSKANFTALKSLSEMKLGDILFIDSFDPRSGVDEAIHAAYYIGSNIFFEKVGSGGNDLYRFISFDVIHQRYNSGSSYQMKFLRPVAKSIPLPSVFSAANTDQELATQLGNFAQTVTVETYFGQGLLSHVFAGIQKISYPTK